MSLVASSCRYEIGYIIVFLIFLLLDIHFIKITLIHMEANEY